MAATKKLVVLTPNLARTARAWHQFVGDVDMVAADRVMMRKLNDQTRPVVLNDRECSILLRWWNYLPGSLIDPCDRDLYDTIREFLFVE